MTFEDFFREWNNDKNFIIAHTSGSTGTPKEIRLKKEFVCGSALRTNSFFSITPSSRLHSCVAADFIGGKMMAVRAAVAGCSFTYETPSNRPLTSFNRDERIDLLAVVPSQMIHILENMEKLPEIGAIIIGGSAIDGRLRQRIVDSGLNAYETYGMTETSSHVALRKIDGISSWFECLEGIRVSADDRGCLVISFVSGERFVTNDLAEISEDRKFRILGRWDDVIITGGKKINPLEIEFAVAKLIDNAVLVTSEPDEKWGQRLIMKIEGNPGIEPEKILGKLREVLPSWKVPKEVLEVEALPRTKNGKIIRQRGDF